ncbi:MAG: DUF4350 domain-containing protein [Verrucomicrobiota bacterium]|nr:DUF4350 domain-containing protein [Verrucomicrobiota bacterium]
MRKYFPIVVVLGCTAAFAFGIVELFELRFAAGDVYPPYSSLRADPLGTMALYESLKKIPGLSVRRDFSASDRLPEKPQTVYLHLAGNRFEWDWLSPDDYRQIRDFLARDGRLVIAFYPQTEPQIFHFNGEEDTNSVKKMTPPRRARKGSHHPDDEESWVALEEEWGFHTAFRKLTPDGDVYAPATVVNQTDLHLPQTLDWHSGIVFTNLASAWRVIYTRGPDPVVVEHKFDRGSVVLATDSYFVSNEAMAADRHADFLAWLVGPARNVVFDEAHFGILETSGVAALMRKYRLQGLVAGLILLAGLFIWKNSTSLVPSLAEEKRENFVAGKDFATGFVNLLRRSIAPRDLLATCFAEWKKSTAKKGKKPSARLQQAETVFSSGNSLSNKDRNPVETYKKISEILGTRKQTL